MGFLTTRRELEKNDQEGTPKDQARATEKRKAEDKEDNGIRKISARHTIFNVENHKGYDAKA